LALGFLGAGGGGQGALQRPPPAALPACRAADPEPSPPNSPHPPKPQLGIASEFSGGALLCGGSVSVRRGPGGDGALLLEGAAGADYYAVRDAIYAQYSVC
jgi:hypothetical protein